MNGRLRINPDPIRVVPRAQRDAWTRRPGFRCDHEDGRGRCRSRETRSFWNAEERRAETYCEPHTPRRLATVPENDKQPAYAEPVAPTVLRRPDGRTTAAGHAQEARTKKLDAEIAAARGRAIDAEPEAPPLPEGIPAYEPILSDEELRTLPRARLLDLLVERGHFDDRIAASEALAVLRGEIPDGTLL